MGQRIAIDGKVLAELRILRRLTQEGLCARCAQRDRHCGLTGERISEYERGVRQPTWPNLLLIADALELSDDEWRMLVCTPTLDALATDIAEDSRNDILRARPRRGQHGQPPAGRACRPDGCSGGEPGG